MSAMLDRIVAFSAKHERLIALVAGAWFAASCASYAGFIDLPEIPLLTNRAAIFVAAGANAVWWGFLRPEIERRKQALAGAAVGEGGR